MESRIVNQLKKFSRTLSLSQFCMRLTEKRKRQTREENVNSNKNSSFSGDTLHRTICQMTSLKLESICLPRGQGHILGGGEKTFSSEYQLKT